MIELRQSGAKLREIAEKYSMSISQVDQRLRSKARPISARARETLSAPAGAKLVIEGMEIVSAEEVCRVAQIFEQAFERDDMVPTTLPRVAGVSRRRVLLAVEAMGLTDDLATDAQRRQVYNDLETLSAFIRSGATLAVHAASIGISRQALQERLSKLLPAGSIRSLARSRTRGRAQARIDEVARVAAEQCAYDIDCVASTLGLERYVVAGALRAAGVAHLVPQVRSRHPRAFDQDDILASLRAAAEWTPPAPPPRRVVRSPYLAFQRHFRETYTADGHVGITHFARSCSKAWAALTAEEKDVFRHTAQLQRGGEPRGGEPRGGDAEEEGGGRAAGLWLSSSKYAHFCAAHGGKHPHGMTVLRRFGSWSAACAEAGLRDGKQRRSGYEKIRSKGFGQRQFTEDQLLAALRAYVAHTDGRGEKATISRYNEWACERPGLPKVGIVRNRLLHGGCGSVPRYESWAEAVRAARAAPAASRSASSDSD